ncbi:metal-responsive CopG/Arc/MetJ family transcriptional regulator [Paenibacillus sacheonensis]|nr:metal-responsive CopG/Arc/MetJ family transcriptional regulator [Paenibacillus sacheonensis]
MKGQTLLESLNYVQDKQDTWGPARSELLALALKELIGNRERTAANDEDREYLGDRTYLLRHTQSYVSF